MLGSRLRRFAHQTIGLGARHTAISQSVVAVRDTPAELPVFVGPSGPGVAALSDENRRFERARIHRTIQAVLEAEPEQLANRAFLLEIVKGVGVPFNIWQGYDSLHPWVNSSDLGIIQIPSEYVDFLLLLRRYPIRTFCEVGCDFGGFSILTAAYLTRACGLREYHCLDVQERFIDRDIYQQLLPLHFHVPATSNDLCGRPFDAVFIDGDHSYWWTKRDFLNLGRHARIFALHDIRAHEYDHLDGGVVRFWNEFKETYRATASIFEIAHSGPAWMGIGVGFLNQDV